jgi:hypothetical protein
MYEKGTTKIIDRREMLWVKIQSLADEARIIRRKEQRTAGRLREELHAHRTSVVRSEARSAQIAMWLIRGKQYATLEPTANSEPDWRRIENLIVKYGPAREIPKPVKPGYTLSELKNRVCNLLTFV